MAEAEAPVMAASTSIGVVDRRNGAHGALGSEIAGAAAGASSVLCVETPRGYSRKNS